MSFILYNQVAYNYEQNAVRYRQRSPIKQGGLKNNELIGELSDRSIKTPLFLGRVNRKKKKSFRPEEYDSFPLPKTTVDLLIQEIDNFHFPSSGLRGEAKVEMVKKILDYRSSIEPSCWELRMRLKSLCEFLDRNDVIFNY